MHESLGSEANPVIETFKSLSCDDQAAIVEFLLSLRLPIDCRYQPCFDKTRRLPSRATATTEARQPTDELTETASTRPEASRTSRLRGVRPSFKLT